MISIITINYNNAYGLEQTISSLLNIDRSSISYIEWIVIDGCSTDDSLQLLSDLPPYLNYRLLSEPDTGIYNAMNKGICLATNPFCFFLNAGDTLFAKTSLDSLFHELKIRQESDVILFAHKKLYQANLISRICPSKPPQSIPFGMPTSHQSIVYRTSILKSIMFDESYRLSSDFAHLCLLYTMRYNISVSPVVLSCFSLDGVTSTYLGFISGLIENNRIRSNILTWPFIFIILYDIWLILAALPVLLYSHLLKHVKSLLSFR